MLRKRFVNNYHMCRLRYSDYRPKFEILQTLGKFYICNLGFQEEYHVAISDQIASGMDQNKELAVAKSISEYVERLAYNLGKERNDPACLTKSTIGFAAYPKSFFHSSIEKARNCSLKESVEKYSWPHFWHNKIDFEVVSANNLLTDSNLEHIGISEVQNIFPSLESQFKLCICIGRISTSGIVVGGGCGTSAKEAEDHAFSEMIRHFIAVSNIKKGFKPGANNYSNRLNFLAEQGYELFLERLKWKGKTKLSLPQLNFDSLVSHPFENFYHVYRTIFDGQYDFINNQVDLGYI